MNIKLVNPDEVVTFEDGFKYYCPSPNLGGLSSRNLRDIADYLDEMNADWQEVLDQQL